MRSGFRPHDRDRTTESMDGVWMGLGPLWRGVGLQRERGVSGYVVNRWSTKRTPNGTKLDKRSTGGIPRPLGKPRSIPRAFNTRSRKENKRGAPEEVGVPDCKTDNGEMLECKKRTRMQNEMHMMTWQNATRKKMIWQRRQITGRHLAHRIRGVT